MMVTMTGEEVAADRLRLAALLGVDPRVGARRVDEGEDGKREFLRELEEAQRLAVALGPRHAEVAQDLFFRIPALLVPDHHAGLALEAREPADDRRVVAEHAIAVQLLEAREHHADEVERVGALRMARDLRDLPGRELRVDVARQRLALLGEPLDLLRDVDRRIVLRVAQFVDPAFQFGDRLLEVEERRLHCGGILAEASARTRPSVPQYSTGRGSRERHRYQLATVRHGRQVSPRRFIVLSETFLPLK